MLARKLLAAGAAAGALTFTAAPAQAAPADLDPTFGGGAFTLQPLDGQDATGVDVHALPGGGALVRTEQDVLVKVRADGSPDPAFGGGDGVAQIPWEGFNYGVEDVAVDAKGRIVVVGAHEVAPGQTDVAVARLDAQGALDTTFGTAGRTTFPFRESGLDTAYAAAFDGAGRIVVAGTVGVTFGPYDLGVARLTEGGVLDRDFAGDGTATRDLGRRDRVVDVHADAGGAVTVLGGTSETDGEEERFAAARYTAAGAPDGAFGAGGAFAADLPGATAGAPHVVGAATLDREGRMLIAASVAAANTEGFAGVVARYAPTGRLDAGFGTGGAALLGGAGQFFLVGDLALDETGGIVAAATREHVRDDGRRSFALGEDAEALVLRLTSAGRPDATFGTQGERRVAFAHPAGFVSVAVGDQGRITAAGSMAVGERREAVDHVALARLAGGYPGRRDDGNGGGDGPGGGGGGGGSSQRQDTGQGRTPECCADPAPRARIGAVKRSRRRIAGTASGAARVEVAIVRRSGKRCTTLTSAAKLRFRRAACGRPRWLRAKGTLRWSLTLARPLGKGRYELLVRPVDPRGKTGATVRTSFRVT